MDAPLSKIYPARRHSLMNATRSQAREDSLRSHSMRRDIAFTLMRRGEDADRIESKRRK